MKSKRAVTLVEITCAALLLMFAIIPIVSMTQKDSAKVVETEKIQMAERILESIKSELMTMKFSNFYTRAEAESLDPNSAGPFELSDGFYPTALTEVYAVQSKYKDFKVVGSWSYPLDSNGKPDKTMVQAEVTCSFSIPVNGKEPITRKKSFLIVKP